MKPVSSFCAVFFVDSGVLTTQARLLSCRYVTHLSAYQGDSPPYNDYS